MRFGTDIRIGCCGFGGPPENYFKHHAAVEIQQTFYRLPRPESLARWRALAPESFTFSLKAWQVITHGPDDAGFRRLEGIVAPQVLRHCGDFRATDEVFAAWQAVREAARLLHARVVLFQSPGGFAPESDRVIRMKEFFRHIERGRLQLAWDPPPAWPADLVREICRHCGLIHSVDPFRAEMQSRGPVYFRLQGRTDYRHRFSDAQLRRLAKTCRRKEGLVVFHNESMHVDARRFADLMVR